MRDKPHSNAREQKNYRRRDLVLQFLNSGSSNSLSYATDPDGRYDGTYVGDCVGSRVPPGIGRPVI
jgi:hypothetical protein